MNLEGLITPIVTFITGTGATAGVWWYANRKKIEAEAHHINVSATVELSEAWQQLAEKLESRVADLETKVEKLSRENAELRIENAHLQKEIEELQDSRHLG